MYASFVNQKKKQKKSNNNNNKNTKSHNANRDNNKAYVNFILGVAVAAQLQCCRN